MLTFGTGLTFQDVQAPVPLLLPQPQPQPLPMAAAGTPAAALLTAFAAAATAPLPMAAAGTPAAALPTAFAAPAPAPLPMAAAETPTVAVPTPAKAPSSSEWKAPSFRHSGGSSSSGSSELNVPADAEAARIVFDDKAAKPTPKRDRSP
eukprot:scaffold26088_cov59-Phaeocystis_antarctica.AAC.4